MSIISDLGSCCKNYLFVLLYYLRSDFKQVLSAIIFIICIGVIAQIFKRDDLGYQALLAFDLADESLNYTHRKSIVSGNVNIFLTIIYAVSTLLISLPAEGAI